MKPPTDVRVHLRVGMPLYFVQRFEGEWYKPQVGVRWIVGETTRSWLVHDDRRCHPDFVPEDKWKYGPQPPVKVEKRTLRRETVEDESSKNVEDYYYPNFEAVWRVRARYLENNSLRRFMSTSRGARISKEFFDALVLELRATGRLKEGSRVGMYELEHALPGDPDEFDDVVLGALDRVEGAAMAWP